jgi:hypothetical protein
MRQAFCRLKALIARMKCSSNKRGKKLDRLVIKKCHSDNTVAAVDTEILSQSIQSRSNVLECDVLDEDDDFDESLIGPTVILENGLRVKRNTMKYQNTEHFIVSKINSHTSNIYQNYFDLQKSKMDIVTKLVVDGLSDLKYRCKVIVALYDIFNCLLLSIKDNNHQCIRDHFLSLYGPYAVLRVMKHAPFGNKQDIQSLGCSILRLSFHCLDSNSIIRKWNVKSRDVSILSELHCIDDCIGTIIHYMQIFSLSSMEQGDACTVLYSLMHHHWLLVLKAQYRGIQTAEFPFSEMEALFVAITSLKQFPFHFDIQKSVINLLWFTMRHGYNKDKLVEYGTIPLLIMILDESNKPVDISNFCGGLPVETERRLRLTLNFLESIERLRQCSPHHCECTIALESPYHIPLYSDDFTALY